MSSRRLFSWSRRQSNAEPYYKTGGLLSIDTLENEFGSNAEAKVRMKAGYLMMSWQCASTWLHKALGGDRWRQHAAGSCRTSQRCDRVFADLL